MVTKEQKNTTIIIVVILLIFFYWKVKSKIKFGCTDLWLNMTNSSAEQIYTETFNMTENNPDIMNGIITQSADKGTSVEKLKCLYSTDYLVSEGIVNLNEKDRINKCICDKFSN